MKRIFLLPLCVCLTLFLSFSSTKVNATYLSWYTLNTQHNVYDFARTFNQNDDYVRGFCFAWDALGGHTGNFSTLNIDIQVPDITNYWSDLSTAPPWITLYTVKIGSLVSITSTDAANYMYNTAYTIETLYLPTITDPSEYNFYLGYINLLYQVSYNFSVLYMSPGTYI